MLLVKANNEGRMLYEIGARERITGDFDSLAAKLLGIPSPSRPSLRSASSAAR